MSLIQPRASVLTVVIPAFNEEEVIEEAISRVKKILNTANISHEIIVVNDGSTDKTLSVLKKIQSTTPLRIINLALNAGQARAIQAGMEASVGNYVLTMDADLQDPPEYIPEMFAIISSSEKDETHLFSNSFDVVQAFRIDRTSDSFWKKKTASMYYITIKRLTGVPLIYNAADFRIMNRNVVQTIIALPEKKLVLRLLIPSLGFHIKEFPIVREKRLAGNSKYGFKELIRIFHHSVIGHTLLPLRLLAFFGTIASAILFLGSLVTLFLFFFTNTVPGWTSLVLLILSFNASLFAGIGLLGEYVGRIYQLVQNRPAVPWKEM